MTATDASLIVAAIDFGTTYSGYAFSTRHDFQKDPLIMYAHQWNSQNLVSMKIPTCILFDENKKFDSFGYDAEDKFTTLTENDDHHDWYYFRRFKMKLYQDQNLTKASMLDDEQGNQMLALVVFTEAIRYLKDDMLRSCRKKDTKIKDSDILWVLTVPAIWNDTAKSFMREATSQAGIKDNQLVLALEPEAAAVYCKHLPFKLVDTGQAKRIATFESGSKYLVLDAGGGTMDITVHEVTSDGKMKELHKANGGDWGGTRVDDAFADFLSEIVGENAFKTFSIQYRSDMLQLFREFEIKKKTISRDCEGKVTFKIPINLSKVYTAQNPGKEIKDSLISMPKYASSVIWSGDKLRLNPGVAKGLFKTSVYRVIQHLKEMFHLPAVKHIGCILMVGGFSESPLLQEAVRQAFEPKVRVIIPQEAGLAVLKGAVIYGHKQSIIQSRICRRTYGISCSELFQDGVHPKNKKFFTKDGKAMCKDVFAKVVEEGEELMCGKPHTPKRLLPLEPNDVVLKASIVESETKNPQFITDKGCKLLGDVVIEMPDTSKGMDRAVQYTMIFGDTELKVEAKDCDSDRKVESKFKFLG